MKRMQVALPNDPYVITTGTTAAPFQLTGDIYDDRVIVLKNTAGLAINLPRATGSGQQLTFVLGAVPATGSYVLSTNPTTDIYAGSVTIGISASSTGQVFVANGQNILTLNGTTTGGANLGDSFTVTDYAAGFWAVSGMVVGSGTLATPFS